jgi:uncharacterized protein (DUF302 family)
MTRASWQASIGLAITTALACVPATSSAVAQQNPPVPERASGVVTLGSAHTVAETERRLVQAIESAGLKVAARIDHRANALGAGLDLPPTVLLVFGDPRAGTPLIEQQRTIGLDLPLKVLIWEQAGRTVLAYNDPIYLARRHGIDDTQPMIAQMGTALERLLAAATGP